MKISMTLDHIDSGRMAVPEFRRHVRTEVLSEEVSA